MVHPCRVLLVEDDPIARELLALLASDMGYDVTSTQDGNEALRYLYSEETCDVVLTDIVMPGMSGIELAQRAREARPGLPFVLITGRPDGLQAAMDAGAVALHKPISRERLHSVLLESCSQ